MSLPTILFSARDPGAARNLGWVIKELEKNTSIRIQVLAQDSAVKIFETIGVNCISVRSPSISEPHAYGSDPLLEETRGLLRTIRPSAIVTGLSGPGTGIDEVLLHLCDEIPSFSLQDSEGWVVKGFGRTAQTYFVASERAADLTRKQADINTIVTGLPVYEMLAKSVEQNEMLSKPEESNLKKITFYGQPLWEYPGYLATIKSIYHSFCELNGPFQIAFRPHPKEPPAQQKVIFDLFKNLGARFSIDQEISVEASLFRTNLAISCFSNCLVDAIYFQAYRPDLELPIGIYFLQDQPLQNFFLSGCGGELPWNLQSGFSMQNTDDNETANTLKVGLSKSTSQVIRKNIREKVQFPRNSTEVIVRTLLDSIKVAYL